MSMSDDEMINAGIKSPDEIFRDKRAKAMVPDNGWPDAYVCRADFDEALALLKCLTGNGCHWCGISTHTPDCRLDVFLKKWGK